MNENTVPNATLTEKEIFDQIVLLQKQLTECSLTSLHRLGEALGSAFGENEDVQLTADQVSNICAVFAQREETLREMLKFYQDMYKDLQAKNKAEKPETEAQIKRRNEFLKFVKDTTVATMGPSLPNFTELWEVIGQGR